MPTPFLYAQQTHSRPKKKDHTALMSTLPAEILPQFLWLTTYWNRKRTHHLSFSDLLDFIHRGRHWLNSGVLLVGLMALGSAWLDCLDAGLLVKRAPIGVSRQVDGNIMTFQVWNADPLSLGEIATRTCESTKPHFMARSSPSPCCFIFPNWIMQSSRR
jgi:hypothetical protein